MPTYQSHSRLETKISSYRRHIVTAQRKTRVGQHGWKQAVTTVLSYCTSIAAVIQVHFETYDVRDDAVFEMAWDGLNFVQSTLRAMALDQAGSGTNTWKQLRKDIKMIVGEDIPETKSTLRNLSDLVRQVEGNKSQFKPGILRFLNKDLITLQFVQRSCRQKLQNLHDKLESIKQGWNLTR